MARARAKVKFLTLRMVNRLKDAAKTFARVQMSSNVRSTLTLRNVITFSRVAYLLSVDRVTKFCGSRKVIGISVTLVIICKHIWLFQEIVFVKSFFSLSFSAFPGIILLFVNINRYYV